MAAVRSTAALCGAFVLVVALLLTASVRPASASMRAFRSVDVRAPGFDVDWGESRGARFQRLRAFALTPLKGWNSYDGWDWSVTEKDMVNNMDYLAQHLKQFGYNIATIDYYWSARTAR